MTCKDCIHYDVCGESIFTCGQFKDKANIIELPCKLEDTVYDVVLCDDNIYRICKMKITGMSIFGELYVGKTIPPFIWNLYLTDKYSYAYRTFSDMGKTVFLTKGQAEMKLRELNK